MQNYICSLCLPTLTEITSQEELLPQITGVTGGAFKGTTGDKTSFTQPLPKGEVVSHQLSPVMYTVSVNKDELNMIDPYICGGGPSKPRVVLADSTIVPGYDLASK